MPSLARPFLAAVLMLSSAVASSSVAAQNGTVMTQQTPFVVSSPGVVRATVALSQGDADTAYFRAVERMEEGSETVDLHIVAAKAALLRAKSAPLLGKKRWAKLGRDHYKSALALDSQSADALLGLATFALRAPKKLGGGDSAIADYGNRLSAASPSLYEVFQARAAREAKQLDKALQHYEASFGQSDQALFEYVEIAEKSKSASRAYTVILSSGVSAKPCASYALARLAGEISETDALRHYDAFLQSGERFCDRRYVAMEAVDAAIKLAQARPGADYITKLQLQKAQFEAERERGKAKGSAAS